MQYHSLIKCAVAFSLIVNINSAFAEWAPQVYGFRVNANVVNTCTIQAPFESVAFGTYDPKSGSDLTTDIKSFQLTCINGTPAKVSVGGGIYYDSASSSRQMRNANGGTAKMKYNLYYSNSVNGVWTAFPRNTLVPISQTGQQITLYYKGVIPKANQPSNLSAGHYVDTIFITLSY